jgi:hypothetical protein
MALSKSPFVSIQRASIELGIPEEDVTYNLTEGHLTAYLPIPRANRAYDFEGKLAKQAKAIQFHITGDKIYYQTLHLLDKDTMTEVNNTQDACCNAEGGCCDVKDILISRAEIEKLRSTEKQEVESQKHTSQTADKIEKQLENSFIHNGDAWEISFKGTKLKPIKEMDGMTYIASLLNKPGKQIHVTDLCASASRRRNEVMMDDEDLEPPRLFRRLC